MPPRRSASPSKSHPTSASAGVIIVSGKPREQRVPALDEFQSIAIIARRTRVARRDVVLGIGDDAAVLRVPSKSEVVAAIDSMVEDVHFPLTTRAADVGWKALAVNLSDLAAMGAQPAWALLALTLPAAREDWLKEFSKGFHALARKYRVALVGGDTTRGRLTVSVQVLGHLPQGAALRRSGARVGDRIFVSGSLGDAAAGLQIAQGNLSARPVWERFLRQRLDRPQPRVELGLSLRGMAHAAIDISDGFAADLSHILRASRVGAEVAVDRLPSSPALRGAVRDGERRRILMLRGGDDYELCFTAAPAERENIAQLAAQLRLKITEVGKITRRRGLRLLDADGNPCSTTATGWNHFA